MDTTLDGQNASALGVENYYARRAQSFFGSAGSISTGVALDFFQRKLNQGKPNGTPYNIIRKGLLTRESRNCDRKLAVAHYCDWLFSHPAITILVLYLQRIAVHSRCFVDQLSMINSNSICLFSFIDNSLFY
ncbi:MAG: hypothetical protein KDE52_08940 [Calditrichaeota bacterium]|nr:hypothetical protein [Calditrichota bacterium]